MVIVVGLNVLAPIFVFKTMISLKQALNGPQRQVCLLVELCTIILPDTSVVVLETDLGLETTF